MIKTPRVHAKAHLDFIRGLPCLICHDNTSTEAAHVRYGSRRAGKRSTGMGEKPHDSWVVPLCSACHGLQHQMGERAFWWSAKINPLEIAAYLWRASGNHELGEQIVMAASEYERQRQRTT